MYYYKKSLISGYQFKVVLDKQIISFKKVTNLVMKKEFEEFQEGGVNDRVFLFRLPRSKADILKLERGIWNLEKNKFFVGQKLNNIIIMVMRNFVPVKVYAIEEGIIQSISISDLDALDGSVMLETLELLHTGLTEVTV